MSLRPADRHALVNGNKMSMVNNRLMGGCGGRPEVGFVLTHIPAKWTPVCRHGYASRNAGVGAVFGPPSGFAHVLTGAPPSRIRSGARLRRRHAPAEGSLWKRARATLND